MGFSVTAATLAACVTPVVKSIPYTNKPEEITPGVANYYASTYYDGHDFVNVLVKTREGRPIFVKNNTETGYGRVNARVNASVLGLYDSARLQGPQLNGAATDWATLDGAVQQGLTGSGRKVLLTGTVMSPNQKRAIAALTRVWSTSRAMPSATAPWWKLQRKTSVAGCSVLPPRQRHSSGDLERRLPRHLG